MNIGGGEAAEELVRMALSGCEITLRLGGSALKNTLALTMALAKRNKVLTGKVQMRRMLRETRDLRSIPMTGEQYRQFRQSAKKRRILYSVIRDREGHGGTVEVILPTAELDRANPVFERILQKPPQERTAREEPDRSKKDGPSSRDSPDTNRSCSTPRSVSGESTRTTNERTSVEERLRGFREQLGGRGRERVREKSRGAR